jgi:cysteine desulfurase / selenocysteine lyase
MRNCNTAGFGPFDGRVWLNCAHEGPLPQTAAAAAREAIRQKVNPHLIRDADFLDAPKSLKASLARMIGANPGDVILGNSASYGLHVLRNGIQWRAGDEVLIVNGDFPATIHPWLGLQDDKVRVRLLEPSGLSLTVEELSREVTPATRLFCVSWVNSFNGSVLDIRAFGRFCRQRGIIFVVNASQGIGALKLDVQCEPIDALVSCGYKWLCGPYGTGFCWITPDLRNQLRPAQTYWLPHVWGQNNLQDYSIKKGLGTPAFDIFCTANFLNFIPWQASIEYLLSIGLTAIEAHNRSLVEKLANGSTKTKYRLLSPANEASRSAILSVSHVDRRRNSEIHVALATAGIDIALRNGDLRFSPHIYNTLDEADRAVAVLNSIV